MGAGHVSITGKGGGVLELGTGIREAWRICIRGGMLGWRMVRDLIERADVPKRVLQVEVAIA